MDNVKASETAMPVTDKKLGWMKSIVFSLIPALLLFSGLEVVARVWELSRPPLPVDYGWGFDDASRLFVEEPGTGMMMTAQSKLLSFRGERFPLPKPDDRFRVFVIGGSNVNFLHEELKLLSARLSIARRGQPLVEIINCGGLAYGSQRLLPVLGEVVAYEPDAIMFYMGHNEFEEMEQLEFVNLQTLPLQRLLYTSAFCRLLRDQMAGVLVSRENRLRNQAVLGKAEVAWRTTGSREFTAEERDSRMKAFRANVEAMLQICREREIPVILGKVATNLWEPRLPNGKETELARLRDLYEKGRYLDGMAMADALLKENTRHQASAIENQILEDLARAYGVAIVDIDAAVREAEPNGVPGETLLSDECHLTERGRRMLIQLYEPEMERVIDSRVWPEAG